MPARTFAFEAIGVVRCEQVDKFATPRQPFAASTAQGRIELLRGRHFEAALSDLGGFSHLWVLFVFDRNDTWHPKVMPPVGSDVKRGVFATRSPHRPNPIGMSVVRLDRIEGLTLHITGVDMLDGTPVLDLKPYVPVADVIDEATSGWLQASDAWAAELGACVVELEATVEAKLAWWEQAGGGPLRARMLAALQRAAQPGAATRLRKGDAGALVLGLPGWRVHFRVLAPPHAPPDEIGSAATAPIVQVLDLRSAHKPSHVGADRMLDLHRAFLAKFGD